MVDWVELHRREIAPVNERLARPMPRAVALGALAAVIAGVLLPVALPFPVGLAGLVLAGAGGFVLVVARANRARAGLPARLRRGTVVGREHERQVGEDTRGISVARDMYFVTLRVSEWAPLTEAGAGPTTPGAGATERLGVSESLHGALVEGAEVNLVSYPGAPGHAHLLVREDGTVAR